MLVSPDSKASGLAGMEVNQVAALWVKSAQPIMVQYCMCFLLNSFAFSTILWWYHAVYFARVYTGAIVRFSAEGYSQREVARIMGVSPRCISKILRRNRDFSGPRQEESGHSPRRQTVNPNGQGQLIYVGSSTAWGDGPFILEEVISSEHCKQASGCWLLV